MYKSLSVNHFTLLPEAEHEMNECNKDSYNFQLPVQLSGPSPLRWTNKVRFSSHKLETRTAADGIQEDIIVVACDLVDREAPETRRLDVAALGLERLRVLVRDQNLLARVSNLCDENLTLFVHRNGDGPES